MFSIRSCVEVEVVFRSVVEVVLRSVVKVVSMMGSHKLTVVENSIRNTWSIS